MLSHQKTAPAMRPKRTRSNQTKAKRPSSTAYRRYIFLGFLPKTELKPRRGGTRSRTVFGNSLTLRFNCPWRSIEGHPCGLPVLRGRTKCGLHASGAIEDKAVPLTGQLGFASWPTLWRHLNLATYDIDPFGLDPVISEMGWHLLNGLYYDYFRVEVEGIEHVPMTAGAVLTANHGGAAIPYDGAMLALAVLNEAPEPRRVRVIGTEIFNMLPVVSHLYRKMGAAYATRGRCTRAPEEGSSPWCVSRGGNGAL